MGAAAARSTVLESLPHVPEGWKAIGVPEPDRPMRFRIAMTQPDEALFEQTLFDISTPEHPRYGQHMKQSELKEMLKPTSEASRGVNEWLSTAGVSGVEDDGEWISFIATVEQAEELLDTQFMVYRSEQFSMGEKQPLSLLAASWQFIDIHTRPSQSSPLLRAGAATRLHRHDPANHEIRWPRATALSSPRCDQTRARRQSRRAERHCMQCDHHAGMSQAALQHPLGGH